MLTVYKMTVNLLTDYYTNKDTKTTKANQLSLFIAATGSILQSFFHRQVYCIFQLKYNILRCVYLCIKHLAWNPMNA